MIDKFGNPVAVKKNGFMYFDLEAYGPNYFLGTSKPAPEKKHWAAPVSAYKSGKKANGCNDSDTLYMASPSKYDDASIKVFGDKSQLWWGSRKPKQVEAFLREYFDNPKLELVEIQKMYNVSNGFPIWHFEYIC